MWSHLPYECETRTFKKDLRCKIDEAEIRLLRRMLRITWIDKLAGRGVRKIWNEERINEKY